MPSIEVNLRRFGVWWLVERVRVQIWTLQCRNDEDSEIFSAYYWKIVAEKEIEKEKGNIETKRQTTTFNEKELNKRQRLKLNKN